MTHQPVYIPFLMLSLDSTVKVALLPTPTVNDCGKEVIWGPFTSSEGTTKEKFI